MLHYPKIPSSKHCQLGPCIVFDKVDGTVGTPSVRAETPTICPRASPNSRKITTICGEQRLVLFDVSLNSQMLGPEELVDRFGHLDIPRILYRGKFKGQNVPEGVVVKGGSGDGLWMAKVKTRAYEERLRAQFGASWSDYWE